MNKRLKNDKAITLVALVVTIVVLLILAGVSINLVIGENGIINRAIEAKDKTEQAAENEATAMNSLYEDLANYLSEQSETDR